MNQPTNPVSGISLEFFTEDPRVKKAIDDDLLPFLERQKQKDPDFCFSDVQDEAGNCYVDLVQEGGGVLGVALVGYTYALEKAGIRFLKMAGTSAGAINTILLAAADEPAQPKSEKILKALAELDILSFVDGDKDAKKFFEVLIEGKGKLSLAWRGVRVLDNFKRSLGLNPGEVFYRWLASTLESYGIKTVRDLRNRMEALPESIRERVYPSETAADRADDWPFALVAADITTESKTVLPQHGAIYFSNPDEVHPAYYVRASMSVPLFFHPLHRDPADTMDGHAFFGQKIPRRTDKWRTDLHYFGETPDKVMFVDGGILSNFPIDIFHAWDQVPRRPTFGVKLGLSRRSHNKVNEMNTFGLIGAAFNAARNMRDAEYIYNNPELNQLVTQIRTGEHNWLNFALTNEDKLDLFYRGVQAGVEFLKKFNWRNYQQGRRDQLTSVIKRLSHDLSLLREAETMQARRQTTSRSMTPTISRDTQKAQEALRGRLSTLKAQCDKIDILWIDDEYDKIKDKNLPEMRFIESLGQEYEIYCMTAAAAAEALSNNAGHFDLIISDIKRRHDPENGVEFLQRMVKAIGADALPPTIFYISDYQPELGTPPYAFGITNSPTELMHLIIDALQRKI